MSILRQAKKAYRSIVAAQKSASVSRTGEYAWICDNMHLIYAAYRSVCSAKETRGAMKASRVIMQFCRERSFDITSDEILGFLSKNASSLCLDAPSVFVLPATFEACALIKLSEICLCDEGHGMLSGCITLLRTARDIDCDSLFEAVYLPEAELTRVEPNYASFVTATKNSYRSALHKAARRMRRSDISAVYELSRRAQVKGVCIGILLFEGHKKRSFWIYAALCCMATALFAVLGLYVWGAVALLCVLPVLEAVMSAGDLVMSLKPRAQTPRVSLKSVPDSARTAAVVTTLLLGEDKDKEVFDRLALFAASNNDRNIVFCVLADLPDADEKQSESDAEVTEYAVTRINELCRVWGDRFCLYMREREYAERDGIWRAPERKRGAITELVRLIKGEETRGRLYGSEVLHGVGYICALDRDTVLPIDGVKELLGAALHPVNKPVVDGGKVTRGFGIIQPAIKTSLESAYKTHFSRLISGEAGGDVYANAIFDRSMALFGEGSFCGKGLIDIDVFYTAVMPNIPSGTVLSHDIVEGELARTLLMSETAFCDDCPSSPTACFKRLHRWSRGDIQNLSLIKQKSISPHGKLKLLSNARRVLLPISAALALTVGAFAVKAHAALYLLCALSHIILPLMLSLISTLLSGGAFTLRRYFTRTVSALTQNASFALWSFISAFVCGMTQLDALITAVFRMISGRNLLEWTTSSQTDSKGNRLYPYMSVLVGITILLFSRCRIMLLTGAAFAVYPAFEILLSSQLKENRRGFSKQSKQYLEDRAKEMWRFFDRRVGKDTFHLPPDNIQYSPEMRTAMRTSPTNIGFYLVSVLAARDMGLIDTDTMSERVINCLSTVSRLKRYGSCLYNWYDLSTLLPLGDYISSVDCGNCFCCLIALRAGLYEYAHESGRVMDAIDLCSCEINNTDLSVFFDEKRQLFSLGISALSGRKDNVCYDLYMSEFRLTAFAAVAFGFSDKRSWQRLSRICTSHNGYVGMLSWSGTAFEYFLPSLFLPEYKNSFLSESLEFAHMMQLEKQSNGIYGISESGYYAFDSAMNYAYKAHGVQATALCRYTSDNSIYAPYAAYLMLCRGDARVLSALRAFEKKGMKGEYGLYEAIDLSGGESEGLIVRSFMSHHMGMSIIACDNACRDGIFIKRFVSEKRVAAALELLKERVPAGVAVYAQKKQLASVVSKTAEGISMPTGNFSLSEPEFSLLCGNGVSAVCDSSGHVRMSFGGRLLNVCRFEKYSLLPSAVIRFESDGECFGCAPLHGEGRYSGEYGKGYAAQINSSHAFTGKTVIRACRSRPGFYFETSADNRKKYRVTLCFEPSLDSERSYDSHPAYSKLFLEGRYSAPHNALIFTRRGAKGVSCIAVALRDKHIRFDFTTSKECLSAYGLMAPSDIDAIIPDGREGACIDPLCLVRTPPIRGGKACFIVTAGETEEMALSNLAALRLEAKSSSVGAPCGDILSLCLRKCCMPRDIRVSKEMPKTDISALWKHGISGDLRLIVLDASPHSEAALEAWISAYAAMAKGFVRAEMAICIEENDNYNRPLEKHIGRLCASKGLGGYIGQSGGIFLLGGRAESEIKDIADIYVDLSKYAFPCRSDGYIASPPVIRSFAGTCTEPQGDILLPTPEGGFKKGAYVTVTVSAPPLPRTHVLSNRDGFGAVITHASLGYTFDGNARENRMTVHHADPYSLSDGERLLCRIGSGVYDLCSCAKTAVFGAGHAEYKGDIFGCRYTVYCVIHPEISAKVVEVRFDDQSKPEVSFAIRPCSPNGIDGNTCTAAQKQTLCGIDGFVFKNIPEKRKSSTFFVGGDSCRRLTDLATLITGETGGNDTLILQRTGGGRFILCRSDERAVQSLLKCEMTALCREADEAALMFVPNIHPCLGSQTLSALMKILPVQTGVCRMSARASFWQAGGAYGFRDQLQDCMMLVYSVPEKVRSHILNAASHQYVEGDVMHWWHEGIGGVRTKCSDDMLWLPMAVAEYIRVTDDCGILDEILPFVTSEPLGSLNERYEMPEISGMTATLREHCIRALSVTETGDNGLAMMGSCDWNDAFSDMHGESMLTTFIYITAARMFLPYAGDGADRITANADRMLSAAEKLFSDGRYIRAIAADGTVYGKQGCHECAIDAAVQAFSVFAGAENGKAAVKTAFDMLYGGGILKLFQPPFDRGTSAAGVIRDYPPGIRENGGQYTHAAVWLAIAAFGSGLTEIGIRLTEMLDPISKNLSADGIGRYKGDPYVLSADIYSAENAFGRAGWSWYTGSAGWYYKLLLEHYMGIKISGRALNVLPHTDYTCDITLGECCLTVVSSPNAKIGTLDGKPISLPFEPPHGKHTLTVPIARE